MWFRVQMDRMLLGNKFEYIEALPKLPRGVVKNSLSQPSFLGLGREDPARVQCGYFEAIGGKYANILFQPRTRPRSLDFTSQFAYKAFSFN